MWICIRNIHTHIHTYTHTHIGSFIYLNFSIYKKTERFKRGKINKNKKHISNNIIKNELSDLEKLFHTSYNWKVVRKFIFNIKRKHLHTYVKNFKLLNFSTHFMDIFYDLIDYRAYIFKLNLSKKTCNGIYNNQLIINFTNNIFNHLNLHKLLNYNFPIKDFTIKKTFKYNTTLGRRIFNYNSFSKLTTSDDNPPCYCNDQKYKKFKNNFHGHVITGDVNIVDNIILRDLMKLGSKHRLPSKTSVFGILKQFGIDLELFIYKTAVSLNKPIELFNEWKIKTLNYLQNEMKIKIHNLSIKKFGNLNNDIKKLQNNFIISYVDKSPNNYAIICKAFYKQLLDQAIQKSDIFKATPYNKITNNRRILQYHKLLNMKCNNFNYPYIVIIPKFHKNPIKFRTVTIGCNTYNNYASSLLLNILSQIYNITIKKDNIHCIKNSFELIHRIKNLKQIKSIITYDFNDLFNNIDIKNLNKIINLLFNENFNKLNLNDKINSEYFQTLTNMTLHHNYILYNNNIYHQVNGIPQGGKASSILADLYLYYFERSFINAQTHFYRYIDDIIVIYTSDSISDSIPVKYPSNLKYSSNNLQNNEINFLDLKIKLINNKLYFDIFDKRTEFPFKVNLFTYYNSCLHKSVYKNILLNFYHRINSLCSNTYKNKNFKFLLLQAESYGYPVNLLYNILYKES